MQFIRIGDTDSDRAAAVVADDDNHIYVARYMVKHQSVLDSYTEDGEPRWNKPLGEPDRETTVSSLAVDAAGNIYVAGAFSGQIDLGGGPRESAGGFDVFVASYTSSGEHRWSFPLGGAGGESSARLAITADGKLVVSGSFGGSMRIADNSFTATGSRDIYLAAFDDRGAHLWSKSFGGPDQNTVHDIAADAHGNVAITGEAWDPADYGGGTLPHGGRTDAFVALYDGSGVHQWSRHFGADGVEGGEAVTFDEQGDVVVTGHFSKTVDFGDGPLTTTDTVKVFLLRLTAGGDIVWSKGFSESGQADGEAVSIDQQGNIVLAGMFERSIDVGGGPLNPGSGGCSSFLASYEISGEHRWSKRLGQAGECLAISDLAVDAEGFLVATGRFADTHQLDDGCVLAARGMNSDVFVMRIAP